VQTSRVTKIVLRNYVLRACVSKIDYRYQKRAWYYNISSLLYENKIK